MKREFLTLLFALMFAACETRGERIAAARRMTGGEPLRGEIALRKYGCNACHTIPGIGPATRMVGPSLDGVGKRAYLARRLPNNPPNMLRWISSPRGIDPNTTMPNAGLTEAEARDIAAYLYTLR